MEGTDDEREDIEPFQPEKEIKKPCNARIDELAKPNKRLVLALWQNYAYLFGPERREAIRLLLQELYAMTPEETAKYFDEINKVLKKMAARERMKKRLLKRYKQKIWHTERNRAYRKFARILQKAMVHAYKHPVPTLVSPRLRNMANVILEQLCDLRGLDIPERSDVNKQSQFLISVSDWLAIAIEHIYYEIQVKKNKEFDIIEEQIRAQLEAEKKSRKSGKSSSSPKKRGGSVNL
ncbi:hypothetical protein ILUMI_03641 [Ignelater luminosus]|uniref:Uncharacterized protein n=1 Tax=Ignelater luminosus TaxID=2038154 RepID=A0A8K0DFV7_IGNLU|nr:hypothetical protein ILUMI_03641 [Ignelater luminosus]